MAKLDWLVVRDLVEIESASFWLDGPEIETGELATAEIPTEVFFLPAASHVEKDGSFTNTQRLLQWHFAAVEPSEDCRSDLWFYYHLGRRIRQKLADSKDERDKPVLELTWDYPVSGEHDEPNADAVLGEINGWNEKREPLSGYKELKDDGSTTCGCWIYCGVRAEGVNQAARKKPYWEQEHYTAPDWAWSWPMNRRLLYNRASADPEGKPWSERKRYVWWDGRKRTWTGVDVPDFDEKTRPDYRPAEDAEGPEGIAGHHPFIMQADGRGWLYAPHGLVDGPLPAHYEPDESPVDNPFYAWRSNPARQQFARPENPTNPPGDDAYPFVATTYRLTEHHTAGGMTRTVPYLAELQPEMFIEVHPELADLRGLEHGGWATIVARVMVTERMAPLTMEGKRIHQVGIPYHWGTKGLTTGDAANDLMALALDPNVHIQESKAFTCDIRPGRRPRP
jgi:formate dehydrogenase major subunit